MNQAIIMTELRVNGLALILGSIFYLSQQSRSGDKASMKRLAQRKKELRWTIERWINGVIIFFRPKAAQEADDIPSTPMSIEAYRISQQLTYQTRLNADKPDA
jgi:hypothetical protein